MGDKANARPSGPAGLQRPTTRVRTECGAGRPQRIRQDDIGGSSSMTAGAVNGRAGWRTAPPSPTTTRSSTGSSARCSCPWYPSTGTGQGVRRRRHPDTPTSSGNSRPVSHRGRGPLVVLASDGVDGSTRMVWEECAAVGMPRAIVITHLESARADFDDMTRICAEALGADDPDAVLPLYLPLHGAEGPDGHAPVTGLIGLLAPAAVRLLLRGAQEPTAGPEQLPLIEEARNRLIEGIIAESEDDPHGPLPGRRADRRQDARAGPGAGRGARGLPGPGGRARRRGRPPGSRHRRAPGTRHGGLPDPAGAPGAHRDDTGRAGTRGQGLRSERAAGRGGREDGQRPLVGRVSLVRVFSGTLRPTRRCASPGTGSATAGTRTTTSTSASAPCPRRSANSSAP